VYSHAERGLPAQANVIGFSMFFLALVIVITAQIVGRKRKVSA
jgi:spermidine/putrescine transport system permease protein